jgi:hypothetical protein
MRLTDAQQEYATELANEMVARLKGGLESIPEKQMGEFIDQFMEELIVKRG